MSTPLGVVLAGGQGRRMGRPKADIELLGRPLVDHAAGALRQSLCDGPVVVAKRATQPSGSSWKVWLEPDEPAHPLCGIVAALRRAEREIVVVACDMPLVPAALLDRLAAATGAAAVQGPRGLEPLLARYPHSSVDELAHALAGNISAREALASLAPDVIAIDDLGDPSVLLLNVNTEEDLAAARTALRAD